MHLVRFLRIQDSRKNRAPTEEVMTATPLLSEGEFLGNESLIVKNSSSKSKFSDLLQKRFILVLLCIFAILNVCSTRVSMSMGLVCMVNHTAVLRHSRSPNYANFTHQSKQLAPRQTSMNMSEVKAHYRGDGPFVWDEEVQGIILSSFFWGYATTQLAGGYLADKYGGKWVMGLTLLATSLLTMIVPYAARFGPSLLVFTRVLCGAVQGFVFPALVSILSKWAPVQERARLFTFCLLGIPLGIIVTYSVAPTLCVSHLFGGWPSLFYTIGFFGIIWSLLWLVFMYEHPSDHPRITDKERKYIESCNMCHHKSYMIQTPWASILKSMPLWALAVCEFCHAYKYFMMLTQLPTFMKVVMNFSLQETGVLSSVPSFVTPILAIFVSWIADVLISQQKMKVGTLRKSATLVGFGISSVCLLGAILLTSQRTAIVVLVWISIFMDSLNCAGYDMSPYDMAPNLAGTIKGIVHTFAALGGIVSPYIIGILTKNNNTKAAWDIAFSIAIAVHVFGGIVFVLFGSGEIQPWNNVGDSENISAEEGDGEHDPLNKRIN